MRKIATVHVRSQHSRGSSNNKFGGPDRYVAVTIADEGVEVPYCLNDKVLAKRGIEIRYCGTGYSKNAGPRSALGQAIAEAKRIAAEINGTEVTLSTPVGGGSAAA